VLHELTVWEFRVQSLARVIVLLCVSDRSLRRVNVEELKLVHLPLDLVIQVSIVPQNVIHCHLIYRGKILEVLHIRTQLRELGSSLYVLELKGRRKFFELRHVPRRVLDELRVVSGRQCHVIIGRFDLSNGFCVRNGARPR
jgi:hypothetical protein